MTYISREAWGARTARNATSLAANEVLNVAFHHPGMSVRIDATGDIGFRRVCSALRGWQTFHMDDRGWADIAYQVAVDQEGRKYTLRGINIRSGANGDGTVNRQYGAVLLILGPGEQPSAKMIAAAKEVQADFQRKFPRVPKRPTTHAKVRPAGTECPGKEAIAAINAGKFDAGTTSAPADTTPTTPAIPTTPPVQEDDDMFITPYGSSQYRMFIDRRVISLSEGTYNILKDGGVTVKTLSNAAVEALASICETYLKVDTTPAPGTEDAYLAEILTRLGTLETKIASLQ